MTHSWTHDRCCNINQHSVYLVSVANAPICGSDAVLLIWWVERLHITQEQLVSFKPWEEDFFHMNENGSPFQEFTPSRLTACLYCSVWIPYDQSLMFNVSVDETLRPFMLHNVLVNILWHQKPVIGADTSGCKYKHAKEIIRNVQYFWMSELHPFLTKTSDVCRRFGVTGLTARDHFGSHLLHCFP